MKTIKIVVLFLPLLLLACWIMYMQNQVTTGRPVELPITGYDPRNLLSGHYLAYTIDWDRADCSQFEKGICPRRAFSRAVRFYVPENYASALDARLRQNNGRFSVIYSYHKNRRPIAKQLLIDGQDWKKVIVK